MGSDLSLRGRWEAGCALSIYVRWRDGGCLLLLELLFVCFNLPVEYGSCFRSLPLEQFLDSER